jgi:hypothetical protein
MTIAGCCCWQCVGKRNKCNACSRCSPGLVDAAAAGSMYGNRLRVWGYACAYSVGSGMLIGIAAQFMLQHYQHAASQSLDWLSRCATLSYAGFCSIACLLLVV